MYTRNDMLAVLKAGFKHELVTSLPSFSQDTNILQLFWPSEQNPCASKKNTKPFRADWTKGWRVPRYQGLGGWFTWIHNRTWGTSWSKGKLSTFFTAFSSPYTAFSYTAFSSPESLLTNSIFAVTPEEMGPILAPALTPGSQGYQGGFQLALNEDWSCPRAFWMVHLGKLVCTHLTCHTVQPQHTWELVEGRYFGERIARIWGTPVLRNYHIINSELITPWFEPSINFQIHHWGKNNSILTLRLLVPKVS